MDESFEALVARVRACSYLGDLPPIAGRPKKVHKLVRKAESLSAAHLDMLVRLLEGSAAVVNVDGRPYAVSRLGEEYTVLSLAADGVPYSVIGDQCSCPSSRLSGKVCKHVRMVSKL